MVPIVESPPGKPFTNQVTVWSDSPDTVAVNCLVSFRTSVGAAGVTLTPATIVKFTVFDVPPPGAGVTTVTGAVPGVVRRAAGMTALN
jgi:hypothetical protein